MEKQPKRKYLYKHTVLYCLLFAAILAVIVFNLCNTALILKGSGAEVGIAVGLGVAFALAFAAIYVGTVLAYISCYSRVGRAGLVVFVVLAAFVVRFCVRFAYNDDVSYATFGESFFAVMESVTAGGGTTVADMFEGHTSAADIAAMNIYVWMPSYTALVVITVISFAIDYPMLCTVRTLSKKYSPFYANTDVFIFDSITQETVLLAKDVAREYAANQKQGTIKRGKRALILFYGKDIEGFDKKNNLHREVQSNRFTYIAYNHRRGMKIAAKYPNIKNAQDSLIYEWSRAKNVHYFAFQSGQTAASSHYDFKSEDVNAAAAFAEVAGLKFRIEHGGLKSKALNAVYIYVLSENDVDYPTYDLRLKQLAPGYKIAGKIPVEMKVINEAERATWDLKLEEEECNYGLKDGGSQVLLTHSLAKNLYDLRQALTAGSPKEACALIEGAFGGRIAALDGIIFSKLIEYLRSDEANAINFKGILQNVCGNVPPESYMDGAESAYNGLLAAAKADKLNKGDVNACQNIRVIREKERTNKDGKRRKELKSIGELYDAACGELRKIGEEQVYFPQEGVEKKGCKAKEFFPSEVEMFFAAAGNFMDALAKVVYYYAADRYFICSKDGEAAAEPIKERRILCLGFGDTARKTVKALYANNNSNMVVDVVDSDISNKEGLLKRNHRGFYVTDENPSKNGGTLFSGNVCPASGVAKELYEYSNLLTLRLCEKTCMDREITDYIDQVVLPTQTAVNYDAIIIAMGDDERNITFFRSLITDAVQELIAGNSEGVQTSKIKIFIHLREKYNGYRLYWNDKEDGAIKWKRGGKECSITDYISVIPYGYKEDVFTYDEIVRDDEACAQNGAYAEAVNTEGKEIDWAEEWFKTSIYHKWSSKVCKNMYMYYGNMYRFAQAGENKKYMEDYRQIMALMEHRRWCRFMICNGFAPLPKDRTSTSGVKNRYRMHKDIRPYHELGADRTYNTANYTAYEKIVNEKYINESSLSAMGKSYRVYALCSRYNMSGNTAEEKALLSAETNNVKGRLAALVSQGELTRGQMKKNLAQASALTGEELCLPSEQEALGDENREEHAAEQEKYDYKKIVERERVNFNEKKLIAVTMKNIPGIMQTAAETEKTAAETEKTAAETSSRKRACGILRAALLTGIAEEMGIAEQAADLLLQYDEEHRLIPESARPSESAPSSSN